MRQASLPLLAVVAVVTLVDGCRTARRDDDDNDADGAGWVDIEDDAPLAEDAPLVPTPPDEEDARVVTLLVTARQQLEAGDVEGAARAVDDALTIDPASGLAHLERAVVGQHRGAPASSLRADFDLALRALPDNPRAHYLAAVFEESQGDRAAAIRGYERTLALRPEHDDARVRLGHALLADGQPALARPHFEAAVARAPHASSAWLGLADACERGGDLPAAERALAKLVDAHPTVPIHRQRLIAFYRRTEQDAKAAAATRALEKLDPKDERKLRKLRKSKR